MKRFLALLLVGLFLSSVASASDSTKVNLKGTAIKRYKTIKIDNERAIVLKDAVEEYNVNYIIDKMSEFNAKDKTRPIFLIINSPGGSVIDGFSLIRTMTSIEAPTVCVIDTEAFSMAAIISQYCSKTYIHKYASILFHEAAFGVRGQVSQVKTRVEFILNELNEFELDLAQQMGLPLEKLNELSHKEWWLTAREAAKFGVVDGIIDQLHYTVKAPEKPAMGFFFWI